jgi:ADP-ribose pyrophosphatase
MTPPPIQILHESKFLRLVQQGTWVYAQRPNVTGIVAVVAVTPEDKLLLVEQFRIPVNAHVIELPAGLAGDEPGQANETLAVAARRELLEETGYAAAEFEELVTTTSSAGMTDECVTLFLARGLLKVGKGGGVASEEIMVHEVPLAQTHHWLQQQLARGVHVDSRVYAGLYFINRLGPTASLPSSAELRAEE